jgi:hypothetical protein
VEIKPSDNDSTIKESQEELLDDNWII